MPRGVPKKYICTHIKTEHKKIILLIFFYRNFFFFSLSDYKFISDIGYLFLPYTLFFIKGDNLSIQFYYFQKVKYPGRILFSAFVSPPLFHFSSGFSGDYCDDECREKWGNSGNKQQPPLLYFFHKKCIQNFSFCTFLYVLWLLSESEVEAAKTRGTQEPSLSLLIISGVMSAFFQGVFAPVIMIHFVW